MDAFSALICFAFLCFVVGWMVCLYIRLGACRDLLLEIRNLLKTADIHHQITSASTDRLCDFFYNRGVKIDRGGSGDTPESA